MKNIGNILSNCHNAKDNTFANRCHWRLYREPFWPKRLAYLYEDPAKMWKWARKTSLEEPEESVQPQVSRKAVE